MLLSNDNEVLDKSDDLIWFLNYIFSLSRSKYKHFILSILRCRFCIDILSLTSIVIVDSENYSTILNNLIDKLRSPPSISMMEKMACYLFSTSSSVIWWERWFYFLLYSDPILTKIVALISHKIEKNYYINQ